MSDAIFKNKSVKYGCKTSSITKPEKEKPYPYTTSKQHREPFGV